MKLLIPVKGTVDLVFADPPFNIGYKYNTYEDVVPAEAYEQWTRQWMFRCFEALKPGGSFYVCIGDEFAAELVVEAKFIGFEMRNWIIWHYTFGQQTKAKFAKSHTHILYFVKPGADFHFDADAVRVPSQRQLKYKDKRANSKGKLPDDVWALIPQDNPELFRPDSDTWLVSRVCGTFKERAGFHGCQMPLEILERIISASSKPGDLVVDPFCGSGTTAVACKKLGRRCWTFDIDDMYVEQARKRVAATSVPSEQKHPQMELFANVVNA